MHKTSNLVYKINDLSDSKGKLKLACFDLDHTLIKPKQNRVYPRDKDDFMLWHECVLEKLMELEKKDYIFVLFTNQQNVIKDLEKQKIFEGRMEILKQYNLFQKFNIIASYKKDYCRKPNTGMYDFFLKKIDKKIDIRNSFYVGDAAGRVKTSKEKKDFSSSDRMFSHNISLQFYTPDEFFLGEKPRKFVMEKLSDKLFPRVKEEPKSDYLNYNIIFLMAPPASGKSTLAQELSTLGYKVINQDVLKTKAKCVKKMKELLQNNIDEKIVLDNTNSRIEYRKSFTDVLQKLGLPYCLVTINTNKEQCFFLDNYRCKLQKKERLPDVAIHSHFKFRKLPNIEEGFQEIFTLPFIPEFNDLEELRIFNQYY